MRSDDDPRRRRRRPGVHPRNFIGTDPTARSRTGSASNVGIQNNGANGVAVGGSTPFERNLIACFDGSASTSPTRRHRACAGQPHRDRCGGRTRSYGAPGTESGRPGASTADVAVVGGEPQRRGGKGHTDGFSHGVAVPGNFIGTDVTGRRRSEPTRTEPASETDRE